MKNFNPIQRDMSYYCTASPQFGNRKRTSSCTIRIHYLHRHIVSGSLNDLFKIHYLLIKARILNPSGFFAYLRATLNPKSKHQIPTTSIISSYVSFPFATRPTPCIQNLPHLLSQCTKPTLRRHKIFTGSFAFEKLLQLN